MSREQGLLDKVFFGAPDEISLHDERINDAIMLHEALDSHRDGEMKANPQDAAFWADMRLSLQFRDIPTGLSVVEPHTNVLLLAPRESERPWSVRTCVTIATDDANELEIADIAKGLSVQQRKFSVISHDADRQQVDKNLGRYQVGDTRWSSVLSRNDRRIMIPHFEDEDLQHRYDSHPTDSPHPKMEADRWISLSRHEIVPSAFEISMLVHPTSDASPLFPENPADFARQMVRFSDEVGAVSQAMSVATGHSWNPGHMVSMRAA